ncbi:MAG: DNA gyrase C-terminal beta-propeller domain-containing protein, partial [Alphaproteobacteria bacterium]|nr:DNA gyrase C-terminal beta-propeller domain-containing protein [Alphaproteobacteria bacterium]
GRVFAHRFRARFRQAQLFLRIPHRRARRAGHLEHEMSERNGPIVATFPVREGDEIMLVTDGGQVIRMPIADIRIAGRRTQGVTVFRIDEAEKVVSVAALEDQAGEDGENGDSNENGDEDGKGSS